MEQEEDEDEDDDDGNDDGNDDDDDDYHHGLHVTSPQKLSPLPGLLYHRRCTLPSIHVDFPFGSGRPLPQSSTFPL